MNEYKIYGVRGNIRNSFWFSFKARSKKEVIDYIENQGEKFIDEIVESIKDWGFDKLEEIECDEDDGICEIDVDLSEEKDD